MDASANGDRHEQTDLDHIALAARIELAISKGTLAHQEAIANREVSEKTLKRVNELHGLMKKLADDLFEQRTGIPTSWSRRLVLVGIAAGIAAFVSGCMQYVLRR